MKSSHLKNLNIFLDLIRHIIYLDTGTLINYFKKKGNVEGIQWKHIMTEFWHACQN